MEITLENVRIFDSVKFPIRPLTIFVGENSAGKTTALACTAAALSPRFPDPSAMNAPPFNLGGFHNIARRTNKQSSRTFKISKCGFGESAVPSIEATFRSAEGEVRVSQVRVETESSHLRVDITDEAAKGSLRVKGTRGRAISINVGLQPYTSFRTTNASVAEILLFGINRKLYSRQLTRPLHRALEELSVLSGRHRFRHQPDLRALSPIRSQPQRTYFEVSEVFDPSGEHIPRMLFRTLIPNTTAGKKLREAIELFGSETGLFKALSVHRYGESSTQPFEIDIAVDQTVVNIADVGYGISQALPLAVEAFLAPDGARLLIQQPEVHLHPRAQAGLASVLVGMMSASGKTFIIETHSDYIVDRVRSHIRNGDVKASDVALLFFERKAGCGVIHDVRLDDNGVPIDPPSGYREFFRRERLRMVGA